MLVACNFLCWSIPALNYNYYKGLFHIDVTRSILDYGALSRVNRVKQRPLHFSFRSVPASDLQIAETRGHLQISLNYSMHFLAAM